MHKFIEKVFSLFIRLMAFMSIFLIIFIIFFILKESLVFFRQVSFLSFITGKIWRPVSVNPSYSIFPIILSTIFVSLIAIIIALPIGIGCALFISNYLDEGLRHFVKPYINILSGIPSVVYGFIGFLVIVKNFEVKLAFSSGESILAGGILLSIMILPFIISTCDESMINIKNKYLTTSQALGVSKWYMITKLILPTARRSILASVILGLARAMGETMAVMMVIGNSPIMPKLLSKGQTIPSLIALEMGGAQVGSLHYHGLFAAGLVLMLVLLCINIILYFLQRKLNF